MASKISKTQLKFKQPFYSYHGIALNFKDLKNVRFQSILKGLTVY